MKKILLAILVLVLVGCGAWYLVRTFGAVNSALYLPEDTVVYLTVTDTMRTAQRWQETDLMRIAKEPAVHEFLKKPLEKLGKMGKGEAEEILNGLKPLRIFWAVTSVRSTDVSWVGGFQYAGGSKELHHALDRLRAQLNFGLASIPQPIVTQYQGVEITQTLHNNLSLFSATTGRWCVLAGDEKGIHELIDRIAGRSRSPSLAGNANFLKGIAMLPKEPDFIAYIQVQPILDILLDIGKGLGAHVKAEQLEQARKAQSISAAFKIDGPLMRDSLFIQTSQDSPAAKLDHKIVQYTSPETLLYYTWMAQWPALNTGNISSLPIPPDILRNLEAQNLASVNLNDVFSPELGFILSWPENAFRPEALVAVSLRDSETAKKIVETVSTTMFPQVAISDDTHGHYFSYPTQNPFFNPTVAITKDTLLLGLGEGEVRNAAAKPSNAPNVTASANFGPVKNTWQESNEAFGYFDTRAIFERLYATTQHILAFGSAMLPQLGEYVDVSKIPEAGLVSRHLTPIVYSQRRVPGGIYMESYGPLTLHQLILLGTGTWWSFKSSR